MGAEPGRQSLKMPAEKLGPVIVTDNVVGMQWQSTEKQH